MEVAIYKNILQKFFIVQFLLSSLISACDRTIESKTLNYNSNEDSPELILSAAASMQDVLQEIKQLYLAEYPDAKITFNFGSSGSLQHQIEQGAPIDIFISAAPEQMNTLAAKELLLNDTRYNLVKNRMVLVTSKKNQAINDFSDLATASIERVALGEPNSVPAGKYAQEILINLDLINEIQSKAVYGKDVRQVLNYVATGNIEAGIVYRTDTATNKKVRIVSTAPSITHSPAIYPIAVVKDSNHPEAAKQLLEFLFTPLVQKTFAKYGFTPLDQ